MKGKKVLLMITLVLAMIFTLSACSQVGAIMGNVMGNTTTNSGDNSGSKISSVQVVIHDIQGYGASDFVDNSTMKTKVPANSPTKEGYVFKGWYTDEGLTKELKSGEKITESKIDIYVKWEVATFAVKLSDDKNGEKVLTYTYGDKLNVSDPTAAGFVFAGWYTDMGYTKAYDKNAEITSELILYAKWEYQQYTITFELNGGRFPTGTTAPETYDEVTRVTLPNPVKGGFDFIGWYENEALTGDPVTVLDGAKGNKTFYAKYLSLFAEMSAKQGLSEEDQTEDADFIFYTDYTEHEIDLRDYFLFSENSFVEVTDITVEGDYLQFEGTEIPFGANEGTNGALEFLYEVKVTSESGLNQNVYRVKAHQYDESTVIVSYVVDGVTKDTKTKAKASILAEAEYSAEAKEGYTFDYWMNGEEEFVFGSQVMENLTLTAKYTAIEYTISYSLGKATNDENNPSVYTIESDITLEDATAPDGYTFVGWYDDETYANQVTTIQGETGDLDLYARYSKLPKWSFLYEDDKYTVTMAQYPYLLDYLLFYRVEEQTTITITDIPADFMTKYLNPDFTGTYTAEDEANKVPYYSKAKTTAGEVGVSYELLITPLDNDVTVTFTYKGLEPDDVSEEGTYDQVNFVEFQEKSGRDNDFTDFAIDHVEATMTVSDSEQLFFALEKGYRPVCVAESRAETLYAAMKEIVKGLVNNEMTDAEKVVAIVEYLVKEIRYDNYVYNLYNNGVDTATYRCFKLEGAILDKVAVCDGISKAFVCLCRIEGIEAVQVDGTHDGTNHAWNKVKVDLDGDGDAEWSVVDCTSANLLLTLERDEQTNKITSAVEVINHAFIFTTDDMLTNKEGYDYDDKWTGLYETETYYNIYQNVTLGEGEDVVRLYVTTVEELRAVFEYYVEEIYPNTAAGSRPISLSVCAKSSLIDNTIGNVMYQAGFTYEQITGGKIKTVRMNAQQDDECIYLFYLDEEEE